MTTKIGREYTGELVRAGLEWRFENDSRVKDVLSLICRHTATYTRLHEWLASGHPHLGGEWINKNWDRLNRQDDQLQARFTALGVELAGLCSAGSPRIDLHSVYGVTITVTDSHGIERMRDVPSSYKGFGR